MLKTVQVHPNWQAQRLVDRQLSEENWFSYKYWSKQISRYKISRQILLHYVEDGRSKTRSWNNETKAWRASSLFIDVSAYPTKEIQNNNIPDPWDKPCVICNHVKCQGDTKRFRIESSEVAGRLLKAANFNKETHIFEGNWRCMGKRHYVSQ